VAMYPLLPCPVSKATGQQITGAKHLEQESAGPRRRTTSRVVEQGLFCPGFELTTSLLSR
jgi:hypothetical protein